MRAKDVLAGELPTGSAVGARFTLLDHLSNRLDG